MNYTTTNAVAQPQKTVDEMLKAIDEALAMPRLIGFIMEMPVYIDGKMPDRMVEIRADDGDQVIRFRADHPYLNGTKFSETVRRP
jgi:hypothetical protein